MTFIMCIVQSLEVPTSKQKANYFPQIFYTFFVTLKNRQMSSTILYNAHKINILLLI